jgi:cytochrome c556
MKTSHGYAKRLEDLIVAGDGSPGAMGSLVQSLAADCKACHATYRD